VSVLELAAAAAVGAVAGWAGHALYRWVRVEPVLPTAAPSIPAGPTGTAPHLLETGVAAVSRPRRVSEGASAARRVILHLYAQGRLAPHEVADPEFTQEGIGLALNLRQGTVARVVGRLSATGVLESDRRHVTGRPRRLTVYTLTALGESVARDLRKNSPPAAEPPTAAAPPRAPPASSV
jgi:DNA-binding MarR family transcriptional regulator